MYLDSSYEREMANLRKRDNYRKLRSEGKCVMCAEPSDGKAYCPVCAGIVHSAAVRRFNAQTEKGLCIRCSKPAVPGRKQCFEHLLNGSERVRRSRDKRQKLLMEQGLCVDCGKTAPVEGRQRCQSCLDKIRMSMLKYRANHKEEPNG